MSTTLSTLRDVAKIALPLGRMAIQYSRGGWTNEEKQAFGEALKSAAFQLTGLADQYTNIYPVGHPARIAGDILGAVATCATGGWETTDVAALAEMLAESAESLFLWASDDRTDALVRMVPASTAPPRLHFMVRERRGAAQVKLPTTQDYADPRSASGEVSMFARDRFGIGDLKHPSAPAFGRQTFSATKIPDIKLDKLDKLPHFPHSMLPESPRLPKDVEPPQVDPPQTDIATLPETSIDPITEDVPPVGETATKPRPKVALIFHIEAQRIDGKDTWEPITEANIGEWSAAMLADVVRLGVPCRVQVPDAFAKQFRNNGVWRDFIRKFEALDGAIDARSHRGGLTGATEGAQALADAGATRTGVLGSLTPEELTTFANQTTFWLLTGIGLPGHGEGEDELHRLVGFSEVGLGVYRTHEGTANSLAKLLDLDGETEQVYDVVRGQAQRPKGVTSGSVLYSPARHVGESGEQAAQDFVADFEKTKALGARFDVVELETLFDRWVAAGKPAPLTILMS